MREIKFRAWVKETSQMIEHSIIDFNDFLHKDIETYCGNIDILMQYTGLKDRNGKEIYEGDLVDLFPEYNDINIIYPIVFHGCSFKVNCGSTPYNTNLEEICEKIEIKGNIYENPDLMASIANNNI